MRQLGFPGRPLRGSSVNRRAEPAASHKGWFSEQQKSCSKNVPFRNTANSVPLMYALMSFDTAVRRIPILRRARLVMQLVHIAHASASFPVNQRRAGAEPNWPAGGGLVSGRWGGRRRTPPLGPCPPLVRGGPAPRPL